MSVHLVGLGVARLPDAPFGTEKTAKTKAGLYEGKPSDPDSVKFKLNFQGVEVHVDRPKGFTMSGTNDAGEKWSRTYNLDYGFIPQTLGGDHDGLDVFIGPNKSAKNTFWVVQTKEDGSFDEYKVMLGFDNEKDARKAYSDHIPKELMNEVSTMSIEMMKAMLGSKNPKEVIKAAQWIGFHDELSLIWGAL